VKRIDSLLPLLLVGGLLAFLGACGSGDGDSRADGSDQQQPAEGSSQQEAAAGTDAAPAFGIGLPAPDFTLRDIQGQDITLSAHRGKAVVVDFWATWCAPCRIAMPHLQALSQEYPDQLAVLAVSLDQDPQRVVPPFAAQMGLTFTLLADTRAMQVAQQWGGVRQIPTAYLIDPDGRVVEKWIGVKSKKDYEQRIRKVLGLEV
jgi:peroxiredoxin